MFPIHFWYLSEKCKNFAHTARAYTHKRHKAVLTVSVGCFPQWHVYMLSWGCFVERWYITCSLSLYLHPNRVYIGKRLIAPPASSFWAWNWRKVPEKWPRVGGESFAVVTRTPSLPPLSRLPPLPLPVPEIWHVLRRNASAFSPLSPPSSPFFLDRCSVRRYPLSPPLYPSLICTSFSKNG